MQYAPGRLLSPIAGGGSPSLDYDFTALTSVPSAVTFTRGTHATMFNSGALVYAPHNLLLESQTFDVATWTKTNASVTANTTVSPLGDTTGETLVESSAAATSHTMQQAMTFVSGAAYTLSVYAKRGTGTRNLRLVFSSGIFGITTSVNFDLGAGTVGTIAGPATAAISAEANGWYRLSITATSTAAGSSQIQLLMLSGTSGSYDGDGTSSVALWGAQCEIHPSVRTYQNTSTSNLLGFSEQLDNAAWTKTNATITANAVTAPNGTLTAEKMIPTTTNSNHICSSANVTVVAGQTLTFSVYAKPGEMRYLRLRMATNLGFLIDVVVNLATGAFVTGTLAALTTVALSDGWWRIAVTGTMPASATTLACACWLYDNTAAASYAGNDVDGLYLWGAQLASSGSLDAYYPNAAAAPTSAIYYGARFDQDPVTQAARGLLIEEARTNGAPGALSNSTYWLAIGSVVVTTAGTSPTGLADAYTVTEPAGGAVSYGLTLQVGSALTITAGVAVTASVFAKAGTSNWLRLLLADQTAFTIGATAWFNLTTGVIGTTAIIAGAPTSITSSIQALSNGWYRCSVSCIMGAATTAIHMARLTSADNTSSDLGSRTMLLYGPQLEAGSFPTSYIPTTTASVTRAADIASMASLGSWYNATEGTIVAEVEIPYQTSFASTAVMFALSDGTVGNSIYLSAATGSDAWNVLNTSVQQAGASFTSPPLTPKKFAGAYKLNDLPSVRNGGAVTADSSGTPPTGLVQAGIGKAGWANGNYLNGYFRRLRYYRVRKTNADLQVLTT